MCFWKSFTENHCSPASPFFWNSHRVVMLCPAEFLWPTSIPAVLFSFIFHLLLSTPKIVSLMAYLWLESLSWDEEGLLCYCYWKLASWATHERVLLSNSPEKSWENTFWCTDATHRSVELYLLYYTLFQKSMFCPKSGIIYESKYGLLTWKNT